MIDLDALERTAKEATPGPWAIGRSEEPFISPDYVADIYVGDGDSPPVFIAQYLKDEDADFIATANPETILSLIARLRAAEEVVETIKQQHRPEAISVLDYDCYESQCEDPEHEDECPGKPVTICAYCWEIRLEVNDEAQCREEDHYPCPTAAAISTYDKVMKETDSA